MEQRVKAGISTVLEIDAEPARRSIEVEAGAWPLAVPVMPDTLSPRLPVAVAEVGVDLESFPARVPGAPARSAAAEAATAQPARIDPRAPTGPADPSSAGMPGTASGTDSAPLPSGNLSPLTGRPSPARPSHDRPLAISMGQRPEPPARQEALTDSRTETAIDRLPRFVASDSIFAHERSLRMPEHLDRVRRPGVTESTTTDGVWQAAKRLAQADAFPQERVSLSRDTARAEMLSLTGSFDRSPLPAAGASTGATTDGVALRASGAQAWSPGAPLDVGGGADEFGALLGHRLIALAARGEQRARIALHPAELGAIEIRINLRDDSAAVSISAQHGHARELIEANLPRLRELFAEQGLNLADVDVSDRRGSHASAARDLEHIDLPVSAARPAAENLPQRIRTRDASRLVDVLA
jgi:flagellar hook-length control protein FliK